YIRTDFNGVPFVLSSESSQDKRALGDVTFSPAPLNFNASLELNETTLFEVLGVTASLDGGSIDLSVTVGGTLVYNVLKSELVSLTAYLECNLTTITDFSLLIEEASNSTLGKTFSAGSTIVAIPGVLSFGPTVDFEIGIDFETDSEFYVELDCSSAVTNGYVDLDYTGNVSASGYWKPEFDFAVDFYTIGEASVTPYVQSTFDLAFSLLNDTYTVSGGISPRSSFPTIVTLDAGVSPGSTNDVVPTVTDKDITGTCTDGIELLTVFDFAMNAYVTGKWANEVLYNVSIPVVDQCVSW
ncbi:hypothetical protein BD289DRAFT_484360, partial [Coniella lustricola]